MSESGRTAERLRARLGSRWPHLVVEVVDETGSTSSDLLERARSPAATLPCLRVAHRQTAGRGRHGRSWRSEAGASLTFSLATRLDAADWSGLSLAVGVALAEALEPNGMARLGLKWPNDLWLLDTAGESHDGSDGAAIGRKLGGVLIETLPRDAARVAVIGVGLNVRPIADTTGLSSGHAAWQELEPQGTAESLLDRVLPALADGLAAFERDGFAAFRTRYAARDLLAGRLVRTTDGRVGDGVCEGVTAEGCLLVRGADGIVRQVASGEVSVRLGKPASSESASGRGPRGEATC